MDIPSLSVRESLNVPVPDNRIPNCLITSASSAILCMS